MIKNSSQTKNFLKYNPGDMVFYIPTHNVNQTLVTGMVTDIIDEKKERYEITLITSRRIIMAEGTQLLPQLH